jgi:neutral ceramidase
MNRKLLAGAATVEITPRDSQFLCGYPHVERYSTGVHDPLLSSALYLNDGSTSAMFIANDIVCFDLASARRIREDIQKATALPAGHVMVTATHTHSGPKTMDFLSTQSDTVEPPTDPKYVRFLEERVVQAAVAARKSAQPARVGLAVADATGIGTNRRDPAGPSDMEVPVMAVESEDGKRRLAVMLVCSMHPTVLHEDSKLVSADFPGAARQYLQAAVLGAECPVLHHSGPCGNQSPRHVTKANTFAEVERIGRILGEAVEKALPNVQYADDVRIGCWSEFVTPPRRQMLPLGEAERRLEAAVARLANLRRTGASRQEVRTAECDWFGAEESVTLARAALDGRLDAAAQSCLPAEVQVIRVGPWVFAGWPSEVFVEYGLAVKRRFPRTFTIELANGELQGYIVTPEAADEGGYEASNALFAPETGELFVRSTLDLVAKHCQAGTSRRTDRP